MKLKICGLSNPNDVEECVKYNVDFCGFIINYPKSHRYINFEKTKELLSIKKNKTKYVGVLVKPKTEELEMFSELNFDYFQIYDVYNKEALIDIKRKYLKKLITAIQVTDKKDIEKYKQFDDVSDIILWDSSGYEKSLKWDYSWIKNIQTKSEKMIAGNITKDKLSQIMKLADIVDVSGALETNKVKDIHKIKNFIKDFNYLNNEN